MLFPIHNFTLSLRVANYVNYVSTSTIKHRYCTLNGISHKESVLCYITKITMAAIENLFIYTVLNALIDVFFMTPYIQFVLFLKVFSFQIQIIYYFLLEI